MKRLFVLLLTAMLSVSCLASSAGAYQKENAFNDDSQVVVLTVQPREFLPRSTTQTVSEAKGYSVDITVKYAVRYDKINASNYFIEGVTEASAANAKGWTYVDPEVKINYSGIAYSNNCQKAAVPVKYYASMGGSGVKEYEGMILIDLLN